MKENKFYNAIKAVVSPFAKLFFRTRAQGMENIPNDGPVIIAANHYFFADPIFIAVYTKRFITFMAKSELFGNPVMNWLMTKLGCVKLNRDGSDISALRTVLGELKKDACIMLFPQGTRCPGHAPLREEMKDGASFLAMTSKAPVVPVGIYTKEMKGKLFRKTYVSFGKPIVPAEEIGRGGKSVALASDMIHSAICDQVESARLMAESKK